MTTNRFANTSLYQDSIEWSSASGKKFRGEFNMGVWKLFCIENGSKLFIRSASGSRVTGTKHLQQLIDACLQTSAI